MNEQKYCVVRMVISE